jgi:hypothetical protein
MVMEPKKKNLLILIAIATTTVTVWQIPGGYWILYPFTILGTWFHEMSHGICAIVLGGSFQKLELFSNGSGIAYHSGGLFFGGLGNALVAGAGPLGPTFAGAGLIALSRKPDLSKIMLIVFGSLMLLSIVLFIRTWFGALVIGLLCLILLYIAFNTNDKIRVFTMQFLGVQACVSVYLSVGYLFSQGANVGGNQHLSDTAVMADNLWLPYWFWGGLIIIISLLMIYKSFKFAYKK